MVRNLSSLRQFRCLRGDSWLAVVGRLLHFFFLFAFYIAVLVINMFAAPEGRPFFHVMLETKRSFEGYNQEVKENLANMQTDWTTVHDNVQPEFNLGILVPLGVIVQSIGLYRICISCFTGHDLHGLRIVNFPACIHHVSKRMILPLLINFPWQIFGLPSFGHSVVMSTFPIGLFALYIIQWLQDFVVLKEKIGILASFLFFIVYEHEIVILLIVLWMASYSIYCDIIKDPAEKYQYMYCNNNTCDEMAMSVDFTRHLTHVERQCLKHTWLRSFGAGMIRIPTLIEPQQNSNYQEPTPGYTLRYVFLTTDSQILWRVSIQYIMTQVRSIGLGPVNPINSLEWLIVVFAIIFGMIWNLWIFYGMTAGWWQDRTQNVCDFEDQIGIIDTYIHVARQIETSEKIRRYADLAYHRKTSLQKLSTFNMDLTDDYQDEIVFKLNINILSSIRMFHEVNPLFLNAIAYKFEPTIFIKGEFHD